MHYEKLKRNRDYLMNSFQNKKKIKLGDYEKSFLESRVILWAVTECHTSI